MEQAFNDGKILRTHVMRPTWHFVHPKDIRWMLTLTAPRVKSFMASYNRKLELIPEIFSKTQNAFSKIMKGEKALTRQELKEELTKLGITTDVQRLAYIVMQAELDCVICSGPRKGKQFTHMLFAERVPESKSLPHDEALTELTKRYFQSHGPATVLYFSWWSGLTVNDAKKGISMCTTSLSHEKIDGKSYWLRSNTHISNVISDKTTPLLPNYDELGIAYKVRDTFFNPEYIKHVDLRGNALFQHMLVYDGQITGLWKHILKKILLWLKHNFSTNLPS